MDIKTKKQRSYNMSRIRSKNTKPELMMFKIMGEHGIKFKKHYKISGRPDIVLLRQKIAVFINGEFWHGKGYDSFRDTLSEFWKDKIGKNILRDKKVQRKLRYDGWKIINFWGRDVVKHPEASFKRLKKFILKSR